MRLESARFQGSARRAAAPLLVETAILIPIIDHHQSFLIDRVLVCVPVVIGRDRGVARPRPVPRPPRRCSWTYATDKRSTAAAISAAKAWAADEPVEMWIYDARHRAELSGSRADFTSCTTKCIKYTVDPGDHAPSTPRTRRARGWASTRTQNAQLGGGATRRKPVGLGRGLHQAQAPILHQVVRRQHHPCRPRGVPPRTRPDPAVSVT